MAIIPWPNLPIRSIEWQLLRPAQINRSAYTGKRQAVTQPGHARWSARVELVTIQGEARLLAWRAFLAKLKGQIGTFRLPATEGPQTGVLTPIVSGLFPITATELHLAGMTTLLPAGRMMTIGDQLVILTEAMTFADGSTTIARAQFEPRLRALPAASAAVEVRSPTALVAMSAPTSGWSAAQGQLYGVGFEVEESF